MAQVSLACDAWYNSTHRELTAMVTSDPGSSTYQWSINSKYTTSQGPYTRIGLYINGTLVHDTGYCSDFSSYPCHRNKTKTGTYTKGPEYGNVTIKLALGAGHNNLTDASKTVTMTKTPGAPTCSVSITNVGVDSASCTGQITNNPGNYWRIHLYNTAGSWQTYADNNNYCSFGQSGLAHNTTYNFYHQYTNTSDGEGSGLIAHSFTTGGYAPTINSVIPSPSRITCSLANNSISYDTNASFSSVLVRYGTTTSYGSTVSSTNLTGLAANTTYYYSMTVTDNWGRTSAAKTGSFTTTGNAPVINSVASTYSRTTCRVQAMSVTYDTNASFSSRLIEYGITTAWGTPGDYSNTSTVEDLTGLTPNTVYCYRYYITDNYGRTSAAYLGYFQTDGNPPTISNVSGTAGETTYGFTYTAAYEINAAYSSIRTEWGTTTSYGNRNNTNTISSLIPDTYYYYRFRVTDTMGRASDWYTGEFTTLASTTLKIKVNGVWKDATPYIKVNGIWKQATAYMNVNGTWKAGIG